MPALSAETPLTAGTSGETIPSAKGLAAFANTGIPTRLPSGNASETHGFSEWVWRKTHKDTPLFKS